MGGKDCYLIKDSGSRNHDLETEEIGYYFYSEDYIKLKMMDFMMHKDAVKDILEMVKSARLDDFVNSPVILIDDACTLCNKSVAFIIKNGGENLYRYVSLYTDEGKDYLKKYGLPDGYDESIVLLENSRAYLKSDAVLRIAKNLKGIWPLLYGFIIIPRFLRDAIYMFVSRHRHSIS